MKWVIIMINAIIISLKISPRRIELLQIPYQEIILTIKLWASKDKIYYGQWWVL
uniref:Uncharacterized protein n=1 Tax=Phlebia radiata TaxID=5308 RepID=L8B9H3_PHLRA|nr:hypothetical protein Pra_mt0309 [Phlebia radiata]YP_007374971.1 hypothetical protein Pra_mt0324 [Phlebia radiata]CCF07377.1 hypothetical protein Pra_mt0309 [Phlebia radiata]CCF07392.1 hypothetical protein Pra_mt0324 [Phlebia radiata]